MNYCTDRLDKYRGATTFLTSLFNKYDNLSENAKKHLNVNISELEKLAVDTLVKEGYEDTLNKETLEKFGYSAEIKKK
jgi:hypothetical protein